MSASPLRICRGLQDTGSPGPRAVTIGNFDGVHTGHQLLLRRVVELARQNGWTPSVLTFDPHPTRVVAPDRAPRLLSTVEQRAAWMAAAGIEQLCVLPFTGEVARWSPEEFVQRVLVDALQSRAVVVGANFRFGFRQAGDVEMLRRLGAAHGFGVEPVDTISLRGLPVSSTAVRNLLQAGDVSRAARLLGRPYCLEGAVVPGQGIGSRRTVPTLNLSTTTEVLPAYGVYVTRTDDLDDARRWASLTNVGIRPTFGGGAVSIETFLLDALPLPSPSRIRVHFLRRLRAERKFESADELKAQILRDVGRAKVFFRRTSRWLRSESGTPAAQIRPLYSKEQETYV